MKLPESIKFTPWDSAVFSIDTYEISVVSRDVLEAAASTPGHYTVRLNPLDSRQLIEEYGFYYCDTLIEPYCTAGRFIAFDDADVHLSLDTSLEGLLGVCHGSFSHGRFHRDFNLQRNLADLRYDKWLTQLHEAGKVYGVSYKNELAAFIAVDGNRLVLHAISETLRGRGLAKYLWSPVCRLLFDEGCSEVESSISVSNMPILNLYASLGFRFRNAVDIYHRLSQ